VLFACRLAGHHLTSHDDVSDGCMCWSLYRKVMAARGKESGVRGNCGSRDCDGSETGSERNVIYFSIKRRKRKQAPNHKTNRIDTKCCAGTMAR
jgi:hypothetical protein